MFNKLIPIILVAAVLTGGGLWYFTDKSGFSSQGYQAVFLTNGQTYFGKVLGERSGYIRLDDVHYVATSTATDSARPRSTLRKLGGELHRPKDTMFINGDNVLYVEEITEDAQLIEAIESLKGGE